MYVSPASQHIVELSSLHIAHTAQHFLTQPRYSSIQSWLVIWMKDYGVGKNQVPYVLHALKQTLMCQVARTAYKHLYRCFSNEVMTASAALGETPPAMIEHLMSEERPVRNEWLIFVQCVAVWCSVMRCSVVSVSVQVLMSIYNYNMNIISNLNFNF